MSASSPGTPRQQPRIRPLRLTLHLSGFAALWAILTGGADWLVGIPVIVLATAVTLRAGPASRWSVGGLLRFIPFFVWHSLRGGIDVATRALNPRLPIDPAIVDYEMHLDSAAARTLMANTVTLLPGTLSAELRGNRLSVHVLNASSPVADMLARLERRVAGLSGSDEQAARQ